MKLLIVVLCFSLVVNSNDSNKELRETNKILKKRLVALSGNSKSVSEEFIYDKEKLQVFINQYHESTDLDIKFAMLEGIAYYTESILEIFEVTGELEGISLKYLQEIIADLTKQIQKHRTYVFSRELADKYNSLKRDISEKDQTLYKIQQENSILLGKLANSKAELDDSQAKLEQTEEKIAKTESGIESLKDSYSSHVENLKSAMQSNVIESISKEKCNFQEIQESQDYVISGLQAQSEHLALKIEQISVENSGYQAKTTILLNNINRLERELSAKSNQLIQSEESYEEFRSSVEENTKKEISNLREAER